MTAPLPKLTIALTAAALLAGLGAPLGLSMAAPAPAASAMPTLAVVPHRAIYSMKLDNADASTGLIAASGTMFFEWGDVCDGWTLDQRYKLSMQYSEADESELSISFVTWEAKDGSSYRFNVRKTTDGNLDEDLKGRASISPGKPGKAEFQRPPNTSYDLPAGTLFPTMHTLALITAAKKGEHFLPKIVFDGGTQDGAADVTASIGKERPAPEKPGNPLLKQRSWPMRMAFFPRGQDEQLPEYEFGVDLQENGIAREMVLDYGSFVVRAKLDSVEALPKPRC